MGAGKAMPPMPAQVTSAHTPARYANSNAVKPGFKVGQASSLQGVKTMACVERVGIKV